MQVLSILPERPYRKFGLKGGSGDRILDALDAESKRQTAVSSFIFEVGGRSPDVGRLAVHIILRNAMSAFLSLAVRASEQENLGKQPRDTTREIDAAPISWNAIGLRQIMNQVDLNEDEY